MMTFFIFWVFAKEFVVTNAMGEVFVRKGEQMTMARDGLVVLDGEEVVTGESGEVVLKSADIIYHLAKSSQVLILSNFANLKNGIMRIRSRSEFENFVNTAHGIVSYSRGDGIVITDNSTKIFVLDGVWYLSAKEIEDVKVEVNFGEFSKIADDGTPPRLATRLGSKSYQTLAAIFDLKKQKEEKADDRKIASNEGRIIYREKAVSTPIDVSNLLQVEAKKIVKSKKIKKPIPVTIFRPKEEVPRPSRDIASVISDSPLILINDKEFEESLMNEYKKQMRYDSDTKNLLDELQSLRRSSLY